MADKRKPRRHRTGKRHFNILGQFTVIASVCIALLIADVFLVSVRKLHARSNTDLSVYADTKNVVTETIHAQRGFIYDSQGNIIAEDNHTYNIICILDENRLNADYSPAYVKDKEGTAGILSEILGYGRHAQQ